MKISHKAAKLFWSWILALRSDEYEQGTGYLCKSRKFCCLGVLSELGAKCGLLIKKEGRSGDEAVVMYGSEYDISVLPFEILVLFPFLTKGGALRRSLNGCLVDLATSHPSLAHMNDRGRLNFNFIADYLENVFYAFELDLALMEPPNGGLCNCQACLDC